MEKDFNITHFLEQRNKDNFFSSTVKEDHFFGMTEEYLTESAIDLFNYKGLPIMYLDRDDQATNLYASHIWTRIKGDPKSSNPDDRQGRFIPLYNEFTKDSMDQAYSNLKKQNPSYSFNKDNRQSIDLLMKESAKVANEKFKNLIFSIIKRGIDKIFQKGINSENKYRKGYNEDSTLYPKKEFNVSEFYIGNYSICSKKYNMKFPLEIRVDKRNPNLIRGFIMTILRIDEHPKNLRAEQIVDVDDIIKESSSQKEVFEKLQELSKQVGFVQYLESDSNIDFFYHQFENGKHFTSFTEIFVD